MNIYYIGIQISRSTGAHYEKGRYFILKSEKPKEIGLCSRIIKKVFHARSFNMIKEAPFGAAKAAFGCGVIIIFFTGILGIVLSFFARNQQLAALVRKRCIIGLGIGVVMIIAWKIYKKYFE